MATCAVKVVDSITFRSQLDSLAEAYDVLKAEHASLQQQLAQRGMKDGPQGQASIYGEAVDSGTLKREVDDVWAIGGPNEAIGAEHIQISLQESSEMAPGKNKKNPKRPVVEIQEVEGEEIDDEDRSITVELATEHNFTSFTSYTDHPTIASSDRSSTILEVANEILPQVRTSLPSMNSASGRRTSKRSAGSVITPGGSISGILSRRPSMSQTASTFLASVTNAGNNLATKASEGITRSSIGKMSLTEWNQKVEDPAVSYFAAQGRTGLIPVWYDPDNQPGPESTQMVEELDSRLSKLIENPLSNSFICQNCVLSPVSPPRMVWDTLVFFLLLYEVWMIPFRVIFLPDEKESALFQGINICILAFFVVDIGVNFSTGFIQKYQVVYSRPSIAKNYLKGWFWVDLVSTLPWDLLFWNSGGGQTLRFSKAHKVLKTFRFLKMIRAVRLVHRLQKGRDPAHFLGPLIKGAQFLCVVSLIAHFDGCLYAVAQPNHTPHDDMSEAILNYYRCFWWAFTGISCGTMGIPSGSDTAAEWTLEIAITIQRMTLAISVICLVSQHMPHLEEHANMTRVKADAIKHLQRHKLSKGTQIQLIYSLNETAKARRMQRHFDLLMETGLPVEVRRSICSEMWSPRLLSLGLIAHVSKWHRSFVVEMAMLVHEEVLSSKTILFKEGDAAITSYNILQGVFTIVSSFCQHIPEFTEGMWLGEKALVNPLLRRSGTAVSTEMSMCMSVPGHKFHDLLKALDLRDEFKTFCRAHLWHGLCGRCGSMGDHFTDDCPLGEERSRQTWKDIGLMRVMADMFSKRTFSQGTDTATMPIARGLQELLRMHKMEWLAEHLRALGANDLVRLESLDMQELRDRLETFGIPVLSSQQEEYLSVASIRRFRELWQRETTAMLLHNQVSRGHLLFLSHYKVEAGTEAALMRTELEQLIREDGANVVQNFDVPVFLDSEDLCTLEKIQTRVRGSHNLALLLTENVLTRPWVLVEIVTAVVAGVIVVPVLLVKGFSDFQFPDEAFYMRVLQGDFLDQDGLDLLKECHIELSQVEWAIRDVFKRIAVPYSPHRPESIRKPELQALLKQCRLRQTFVKQHEDDGTKPVLQSRSISRESSLGSKSADVIRQLSSIGKRGF